jgi:prepilin-type N-terminal cleavage/methylation domain-containing protein
MRTPRRSGLDPTPWRSCRSELHQGGDGGFTLIELIIVSLVLPIVIGAVTLALVSVFSIQTSDSSRLSASGDAQVTASNFETDVQAASMIIAPLAGGGAPQGQSPATCGSGTEVVSLQSGTPTGSVYPTEISYVIVQQSSSYTLVRNVCQNGTQTSSTTVSYNVPNPTSSTPLAAAATCASTLTTAQALVVGANTLSVSAVPAQVTNGDSLQIGSGSSASTVSATATNVTPYSIVVNSNGTSSTLAIGTPVVDSNWPTTNCGASTAWIAATSLTGVTLAVTEPNVQGQYGSGAYAYTLSGTPRASTPANPLTTVSVPTATSCGFATANTGTYASSLCFVDFSGYDPAVAYSATASASNGCQEMSASVESSFTLTFCVSVTGTPVGAHVFPTWTNAFLGNLSATGQPFYTGVPGSPAIYQTGSGTTTVNFTGITVTTSNGTKATGWSIVTGDAETTDANESITWTSDQPFTLLPNSATSQVGNACSNPTSPDGVLPQTMLSGGTSLTVECASSQSVSTPRTGTVMLEAPAPTTLTDTLVGGGLEGVFIGLLIPSGS